MVTRLELQEVPATRYVANASGFEKMSRIYFEQPGP